MVDAVNSCAWSVWHGVVSREAAGVGHGANYPRTPGHLRTQGAKLMPKRRILDTTIILPRVLSPYQFHEGDGSLLCQT